MESVGVRIRYALINKFWKFNGRRKANGRRIANGRRKANH